MNPRTLPRHELAGLRVEVVDSPNADLIGVSGTVVDETTNTLLVGTGDGTKQVPKAAATFRFTLEDGREARSVRESRSDSRSPSDSQSESEDASECASGDEPRTQRVIVEGWRLVARPARRTETTATSKWR